MREDSGVFFADFPRVYSCVCQGWIFDALERADVAAFLTVFLSCGDIIAAVCHVLIAYDGF